MMISVVTIASEPAAIDYDRRVIARRCRPRPWSTWNTIARPCLACRGVWYEASSGKTV